MDKKIKIYMKVFYRLKNYWIRVYSFYKTAVLKLMGATVGKNVKFYGRVIFKGKYENIFIGNNCTFNEGVYIAARAKIVIGNNVRISAFSKLITANLDLNSMTHKFDNIQIDDNCWIGTGSTILPGITLENNSVVAAGSVVTKNVLKNTIVAGVPAKIIERK